MKFSVKKVVFDKLKDGSKTCEFRDAHIVFVSEETGEEVRKEVVDVGMRERKNIVQESIKSMFHDENIICFVLK